MKLTRSFDLKDLFAQTQQDTLGAAPTKSALHLGLSIGESGVFNSGAALLASIKASPSTAYLTHIAFGTDATPINKAAQTALIAEVYRDQLAVFDSVVLSPAPSAYICQIYVPVQITSYHIQEVGIFGDGGATLFCRQLLNYDNSVTPVDLMITWLLTFTPV